MKQYTETLETRLLVGMNENGKYFPFTLVGFRVVDSPHAPHMR